MAHPGTGSTGHLATFLLAQALGVQVDHIPYRGAAPMLTDTLGGRVNLFFATPQQVVGVITKDPEPFKGFGVTAKDPSPLLPGRSELRAGPYGPKLEILFWHVVDSPTAGTPQPVVAALNAALQEGDSKSRISAPPGRRRA